MTDMDTDVIAPTRDARATLKDLIASHDPPLDLATVSRAIGRNHAYLQQYLRRGVPKHLPEKARFALADFFNVDHRELIDDPDDLKRYGPPPSMASAASPQSGTRMARGIPFQGKPTFCLAHSGLSGGIYRDGIGYFLADSNGLSAEAFAVEVSDHSLDRAGFMPGDIVLSERDAPLDPGRFVIAKLEQEGLREQYIVRLYQPPILTHRSSHQRYPDITLDSPSLTVLGPVLRKITLF